MIQEFRSELKNKCFQCGGEVTGKRIHWDGNLSNHGAPNVYGDIDLHSECAAWMFTGMQRDVIEWYSDSETADHRYEQHKRISQHTKEAARTCEDRKVVA